MNTLCKEHGHKIKYICLEQNCECHLMCFKCEHKTCMMEKISIERVHQILQTSESILYKQNETEKKFTDKLAEMERETIESATRTIKYFYKELYDLFCPSFEVKTFSETFQKMKSTFKDFEKDYLNKELKNKFIQLTRCVSKIGCLNVKLFEGCFDKLESYSSSWNHHMGRLLGCKIREEMTDFNDLRQLDVDEEKYFKKDWLLQCNRFGKLIGPQFVYESKNSKFALDDSSKIEQFSEELEKLKTFDQDVEGLLGYINTVNIDEKKNVKYSISKRA